MGMGDILPSLHFWESCWWNNSSRILTSGQKFAGLSESVSAYDDFRVLFRRYAGRKFLGESTPERTASLAQGGANRDKYFSSVRFQLRYPTASQRLSHILGVLTPYFTRSIPGVIDHVNASFQHFLCVFVNYPLEYLLLKRRFLHLNRDSSRYVDKFGL